MPPKVLRRCSLCNNFHAAYLVEDKQLGKLYLCYTCWKKRQEAVAVSQAAKAPPQSSGEPGEGDNQGSEAAGDRREGRAER